ncbi:MAG: hypothetical protein HKN90_04330, partial [Flavobacteriaceae bacterium]|nr:hypothetical protein [Flavobacteriaceae bacterium]
MKSTFYIVIILIFSMISITSAQVQQDRDKEPGTYSDRITDTNGQPLSGISVRVRGKGTSTTTNSNGEFTIKAE